MIKLKSFWLSVLCFSFSVFNLNAYHFTWDNHSTQAQIAIYELRFNDALLLIKNARQADANNLIPDLLENMAWSFRIFVEEDRSLLDHYRVLYKQNKENLEKGSDDSPWRLYALGELNIYAVMANIKFDEYYQSAMHLRLCYKKHQSNIEKFPKFIFSYKTYGAITAIVGTLPKKHQNLIKIFGIEGNTSLGKSGVQKVANFKSNLQYEQNIIQEAGWLLSLLYVHLDNDPHKAWNTVLDYTSDANQNLLSAFFKTSIGLKAGKCDEVIKTLEERARNKNYLPFCFLNYQEGLAKLFKQDQNAVDYLFDYLNNSENRNYKKSACQKISWYYLIQGDKDNYQYYRERIKLVGFLSSEEDKQAQKYAESKTTPDVRLLKARLFFDGGYYQDALKILKPLTGDDFDNIEQKAEYCYRKGRVYQKLKQDKLAIMFFKAAIDYGKNLEKYYAAYAALQIAIISETNGEKVLARAYYKRATQFNSNKEYTQTIEQISNAGLQRLK